MAFFDALASVEKEDTEVPNHLRDASRDAEGFGHGQGYIYPHTYRDHWAAQQYLPDALVGRVFFSPSTQGYEGTIREEVLTRRELQISAILEDGALDALDDESDAEGDASVPEGAYDRFFYGAEGRKREFKAPRGEILTFTPGATKRDEWTKRLDSGKSATLLEIRNRLTEMASIVRHHRVLVWGADDGLLIWEAGRLAPEGFAAGICRSERARAILDQYGASLDALDRPALAVVGASVPEGSADPLAVPFDRILARDPGATVDALISFVREATSRIAPGGKIVFSARIPSRGMRLSSLLDSADPLRARASEIEEVLFRDQSIPIFAWDEKTLVERLRALALTASAETRRFAEPRRVSSGDLSRWFDSAVSPYALALSEGLGEASLAEYRGKLEAAIRTGPIAWDQEIVFCAINA
jgi:putative ATPase